jgi:predicted small lipoprotein YifL
MDHRQDRIGDMRRIVLLGLLLLPLALAACGKKGNLEVPPTDADTVQDRGSNY